MVQENVGSGMSEYYVARLTKANYAIEKTLCKKKKKRYNLFRLCSLDKECSTQCRVGNSRYDMRGLTSRILYCTPNSISENPALRTDLEWVQAMYSPFRKYLRQNTEHLGQMLEANQATLLFVP